MNKMILTGLLLASALGCHGTTLIGGTDGGECNVTIRPPDSTDRTSSTRGTTRS